jgi:hypothetical protein
MDRSHGKLRLYTHCRRKSPVAGNPCTPRREAGATSLHPRAEIGRRGASTSEIRPMSMGFMTSYWQKERSSRRAADTWAHEEHSNALWFAPKPGQARIESAPVRLLNVGDGRLLTAAVPPVVS